MNFKIFFINLKDNPEPWIKAQNVFSLLPDGLELERIDAIDTRKSLSPLKDFGLNLNPVGITNKLYFSENPGASGCYLSHFFAWQQVIEQKLDFALILEEDVVLSDVVQFLLENPDLQESIEFTHLGKNNWKGLEAYVVSYMGATKLIELTLDNAPLLKIDPSKQSHSNSLVFSEKPNFESIIQQNPEFDWMHKNNISSPVNTFAMYCCSSLISDWCRLNYKLRPIIDLHLKPQKDRLINSKNFYEKKETKIQELFNSWRFEYWRKNPSITVCICTYNNYELLEKAFISCTNQLGDYEYKILIVDNTPKKLLNNCAIKQLVANYNKNFWEANIAENQSINTRSGAEYYHKTTNGLSGARNECLNLCSTDLIYFIDDDAILQPNSVTNMVSKFVSPDIGVVGGKVTPDWGELDRPSWLGNEQLHNLSMCDFSEKDLFLNECEFPIWLVGTNICFRTEYARKAGGFNKSLGRKGGTDSLLSGEEDDLVKKISKNYFSMYTPNCEVFHFVQESRLNQGWFIKRNVWQAVSNMIAGEMQLSENSNMHWFIKENMHLIFEESKSEVDFDLKCKIVACLTYLLLNGDI